MSKTLRKGHLGITRPMSFKQIFNYKRNLLIRKHGKLPEDYSIVGFDNSSISSEAIIPISTIGQQTDIIANEAMELLVMQIEEQKRGNPDLEKPPVHKVVQPVSVCHDTTKI